MQPQETTGPYLRSLDDDKLIPVGLFTNDIEPPLLKKVVSDNGHETPSFNSPQARLA